jgi:hypothetical protein
MIRLLIKCFGGGCIVAGPVFLILAFALVFQTQIFLASSITASGTIESFAPVYNDDHEISGYAPVFSFQTIDGQAYTVTSTAGANPPGFVVGQRVKVLYERLDPASARIATFWQLWFLALNFGLAGVGATVIGFFFLRYARRQGWKIFL